MMRHLHACMHMQVCICDAKLGKDYAEKHDVKDVVRSCLLPNFCNVLLQYRISCVHTRTS